MKYFDLKINEKFFYLSVDKTSAKWIQARIVKRLSKLIYIIEVKGARKRVHRNQIRKFVKEPYVPTFVKINVKGGVENSENEVVGKRSSLPLKERLRPRKDYNYKD